MSKRYRQTLDATSGHQRETGLGWTDIYIPNMLKYDSVANVPFNQLYIWLQ